jgi:HrpA-like RNA helicase
MSATLALNKFLNYFGEKFSTNIIKVEGRTFPISLYNTLSPLEDYLSSIVQTILQIYLFED